MIVSKHMTEQKFDKKRSDTVKVDKYMLRLEQYDYLQEICGYTSEYQLLSFFEPYYKKKKNHLYT